MYMYLKFKSLNILHETQLSFKISVLKWLNTRCVHINTVKSSALFLYFLRKAMAPSSLFLFKQQSAEGS